MPVTGKGSVVDVELIQQIVEQRTGIPVRKLQSDEQNKMRNLAERLNAKVIGQKVAVEKYRGRFAVTGPDSANRHGQSDPSCSSDQRVSEKPNWRRHLLKKCSVNVMR
ncbi:ClpB protein [Sporolactobacillus inulinus]|uniref:ClpB protein n=1 Tax=Sporolactobacillus inulinus TaxID=2078 RepID=A0A4Y1ZIC7_9BACL|nr:ClpB protein [Sporolactobacillus inulinus]